MTSRGARNPIAAVAAFVLPLFAGSVALAQAVPPGLASRDGAPLPGLIDDAARTSKGGGLDLPKPATPAGGSLTLPRPADQTGSGQQLQLPRPAAGSRDAPAARQQRGLDAEAQNRGDYPVLRRDGTAGTPEGAGPYQDALLGVPLGRIQPAWDDAVPAPGQVEPGTVRFPWRVDRVMPLRLRLGIPTAVVLPECEAIERVSMGDEDSVPWEIPQGQGNVVLLRPKRAGVDTALQVFAKSGRLYTFYLRTEGVETNQVTDLKAFVDDDAYCARAASATNAPLSIVVGPSGSARSAAPAPRATVDRAGFQREEGAAGGAAGSADFAVTRPFRLEDLSFDDIRVYAPNEESKVLGPVRAFHDGRRTFLDYGKRMGAIRLPAAFLLVDGVDQPVAVRWAGAHGQILVIDAVGDLTLKSGDLYLCVRNRYKPSSNASAIVDASLGRDSRSAP